MRRTRPLVAVPLGLVLLAGCGLGDRAPHPGLAAKVDGDELSLAKLDTTVDAFCKTTAADPQGQATSRSNAATQILTSWISAEVVLKYAAAHGVSQPVSVQDMTGSPGWSDLTADQQHAAQEYVDDQAAAEAVKHSAPDLKIDPSGFDILINPRFGIGFDGVKLAPVDNQLSVGVSSGSPTPGAQLKPEQVAALPDNQLCGRRPDPGQIPVGG